MTEQNMNNESVQNETTTSHIEPDGSMHVVHKDNEATDDFLLKMVKTDAFKTMTNN
ncbi:hypothetical protein IM538_12330 [Cytobacillus suaedae]|nr:hypothetical protein IM538_12330 [Cytobacillus suaedae]